MNPAISLSKPISASGRAEDLRQLALVGVVHGALFCSIWLVSVVVYAFAFTPNPHITWTVVDAILIAVGMGVVYTRRNALGFRALGANRELKLAAIVMVGLGCVLAAQKLVVDSHLFALDESHYMMTVREGRIIPDGRIPYNIRWLVPFLAGPWNFLPVDDMEAVKALNFGAFVVTAVVLILLLVRLRVPLALAVSAPVFLLCSYLGRYGGYNRLVLDPANYALFLVLFHTLIRREHWPYFGFALLIAAFNAEKAVYWIPVFVIVELLRSQWTWKRPWNLGELRDVALRCLWCLGPTLAYGVALSFYLAPSSLEANLCFENLHVMSFNGLGGKMADNVRHNGFQMLWFPFGWFTVYTLLGFARGRLAVAQRRARRRCAAADLAGAQPASWSGQPAASSAARRAPWAAPARAAPTRFEGSRKFLPMASSDSGSGVMVAVRFAPVRASCWGRAW